MRGLLILLFLVALPVLPQEAMVLQLPEAFRIRAQELHRRQVQLDIEKETLRIQIVHEMLEASQGQKGGCRVASMLVQTAWACAEIQFSSDYRSIVPGPHYYSIPSGGQVYELINGAPTVVEEKQEDEN